MDNAQQKHCINRRVMILYMLHHKACNAGAESTEIPAPNMSEAYTHIYIFSLHATGPQYFSIPHVEL